MSSPPPLQDRFQLVSCKLDTAHKTVTFQFAPGSDKPSDIAEKLVSFVLYRKVKEVSARGELSLASPRRCGTGPAGHGDQAGEHDSEQGHRIQTDECRRDTDSPCVGIGCRGSQSAAIDTCTGYKTSRAESLRSSAVHPGSNCSGARSTRLCGDTYPTTRKSLQLFDPFLYPFRIRLQLHQPR